MPVSFRASALYIFWILHQTTTTCVKPLIPTRCISFESYIKPQPQLCHLAISAVVYLLNPTSNHNYVSSDNKNVYVVYLLNPTSNHNLVFLLIWLTRLYIFWILHQTTTPYPGGRISTCCISFESYIKPQRSLFFLRAYNVVYLLNPTSNHNFFAVPNGGKRVVYLLNPTSNHNRRRQWPCRWCVVYLLNPTSNHNDQSEALLQAEVVYLLNPTSNHNVQIHLPGSIRLYIFWILHQTTTDRGKPRLCRSCISFESYIKPQLAPAAAPADGVVYLLNPTSNHNQLLLMACTSQLYIFWILHQTTTSEVFHLTRSSCISFESYIKPQLMLVYVILIIVVYLLNPTSNHNLVCLLIWLTSVVYLLNPTSNHNMVARGMAAIAVVYLLNPTSNHNPGVPIPAGADVVYLLNPTSNHNAMRNPGLFASGCISFESYIKPQLRFIQFLLFISCISFESYIKPQLILEPSCGEGVVYLLNPTSNHNLMRELRMMKWLYIFWILHQTTTLDLWRDDRQKLYIFWILHQTTTERPSVLNLACCISFESYIKPQHILQTSGSESVVYLLNPTSNHNHLPAHHYNQTLYIFWILHQTTTLSSDESVQSRCISFESYIKPQLTLSFIISNTVVYLLNPTSNHNSLRSALHDHRLYIFWILHQTTTHRHPNRYSHCCISFESYIKPQLTIILLLISVSCISFESYIKPQPIPW